MKRLHLIVGATLCGAAILAACIALKLSARGEVEILSVGIEKNEWTPIRIRISPGQFGKCYVRCEVSGGGSYSSSTTALETVVSVLTGTKGGNPTAQSLRRAQVLHMVKAGDRFEFNSSRTKVKLFECIDNLNQRWVHYAGVEP